MRDGPKVHRGEPSHQPANDAVGITQRRAVLDEENHARKEEVHRHAREQQDGRGEVGPQLGQRPHHAHSKQRTGKGGNDVGGETHDDKGQTHPARQRDPEGGAAGDTQACRELPEGCEKRPGRPRRRAPDPRRPTKAASTRGTRICQKMMAAGSVPRGSPRTESGNA